MNFLDDCRILYLVAFSPDFTNWHGDNARIGGFDWYYEREAAINGLTEHMSQGDTGHDLILRTIAVPKEWTPDEITDWLNTGDGYGLWELPMPAEWDATKGTS